MNKKFLFGSLAIAGMLFATSCTNDDLVDNPTGNEATVQFNIKTSDALTRAISDGTSATQLVYKVFRVEGTNYIPVDGNDVVTIDGFSSGDNVSLKLAKGHEYAVAFWAQSPNAPYTFDINQTEGLAINMNYRDDNKNGNNAEYRDAFFGHETFTVSGNDAKVVTLYRPFAQVNVGASDYSVIENAGMNITKSSAHFSNVATKLNVISGSVEGSEEISYTLDAGDLYNPNPDQILTAGNGAYTWLSMCYVLPNAEPDATASTIVATDFTFETTAGAITLSEGLDNTPIRRNYRTNIIGNVLSGDVNFQVIIDENFQTPDNDVSLWDGESVSEGFTTDDNGNYLINTAADFALLMKNTQNANSLYLDKTFVLNSDISFGGNTITGVGSDIGNMTFTFDGNGHTISDFVINNSDREWYTGLFNQVSHGGTIKNLTVKNAIVVGNRMVGVIASSLDYASITDCTVEDCIVVANKKKAGAITGYTSYGNVTNCNAKNVEIYCADSDVNESNQIVGYVNTGSEVNGNTPDNVNVVRGKKGTIVTNKEELKNALPVRVGGSYPDGGIIILTNDIDMTGWTSFYGTYTSFIIEGNGHSLKGLTTPLYDDLGMGTYVVRNLNFDNANINNDATMFGGFAGVLVTEMKNNGGVNLTIDNCCINNSSIHGYKYAGGFIGYTNNGTDGSTAIINIKNSTINNCNVTTDDSSCGGFVGHTYAQQLNLVNCAITGTNNEIKCAENREGGAAKAGIFIGTVNSGTTTITSPNVVGNVTLTNVNGVTAAGYNDLVGRIVNGSVVLN